MAAYYNELDPFAAAWLRELIKAGQIADGEVDERSIADVRPDDLRGFRQCHFFAGIGGWSLALRLAGWPDDRPVWTGSCPCQPFSSAGRGGGINDDRHLWPTWFPLIEECRPATVFGEQVANAPGLAWLDAVFNDLEGGGYACGAAVVPACSVGAPHRRQRLWFVADADRERCDGERLHLQPGESRQADVEAPWRGANALADACGARSQVGSQPEDGRGDLRERREGGQAASSERAETPWSGAVWHRGADGVERAIGAGVRLMADGIPNRVGRIRGYGNAIVPAVAAAFIESYCEAQVVTPGQERA